MKENSISSNQNPSGLDKTSQEISILKNSSMKMKLMRHQQRIASIAEVMTIWQETVIRKSNKRKDQKDQ